MPVELLPARDVGPAKAFGDLVRTELSRLGGGTVDVVTAALGWRNELAERISDPTTPDDAVPVWIYGHQAIVGPFPVAGRPATACPRCLARRWQAVKYSALRDGLELLTETHECGPSPYHTEFIAATIAALVLAHRENGDAAADLFPPVFLVDLDTLTIRRHCLVPDVECPACGRGAPDSRTGAVLTLESAPKRRRDEFRGRDIDDYRLPVEAFANPVCGSLGPAVSADLSSPSTSATFGAFSTRSGEYLRETMWGGHADNYRDSVRIGLLEGMERFAGIRARGKRTVVVDSLTGLGSEALDPRDCGVYSDEFYRGNPHIRPFSADRAIPWVWGYSMRRRRPVLVPEVLAYYHAPGLADRFVQETSNGSASGGTLAEAVYFGLMEVMERDAFLLTWYGKTPMPEIDARSSGRRRTRQMVDRLEMYGYRAQFFDIRVTFSIPVVLATATRLDGGLGALCVGAGASVDPEAAMAAALCEIATDSVNLRARAERDHDRLSAMVDDFDKVLALHDHPLMFGIPAMARHADFLFSGSRGGPAPMAELYRGTRPAPALTDDLKLDVERCIDEVGRAGFDVIVVDQTVPEQTDLGLRTVKVLVPGLLPIDFGWQRQRALRSPRLCTAHRQAGLRDSDLRPEDLHRVPHPFP